MYDDDYATFLSYVDPDETVGFAVASLLFPKMNRLARSMSSNSDADIEDVYESFFNQVSARTDVKKGGDLTAGNPYKNMVKAWGAKTGSAFAISTYYYLYTLARGQPLVKRIDSALFEGQTFAEKFSIEFQAGSNSPQTNCT